MQAQAGPLLDICNLTTRFPVRAGVLDRVVAEVHAVENVSFQLRRGEIFGLVGESGSGKTTVGRSIMRLNQPSSGRILLEDTDLLSLDAKGFLPYRRRIQMIFQDPFASLNPRKTVAGIIGEALAIHRLSPGAARPRRIAELLDWVGLPADAAGRYPHQFSGGQRQRIGIARALAVNPELLVADEPISALDVSIQAQIINLLAELKKKLDLTILFISHDLSVVEHICDRVGVMYLGRLVEIGATGAIFGQPRHPYTRALIETAPRLDFSRHREHELITGEIPSAIDPPSGCVFRTRCPEAARSCATIVPSPDQLGPDHAVCCLRHRDIGATPLGIHHPRSDHVNEDQST